MCRFSSQILIKMDKHRIEASYFVNKFYDILPEYMSNDERHRIAVNSAIELMDDFIAECSWHNKKTEKERVNFYEQIKEQIIDIGIS